jgi:hypothetical protein
MNWTRKIIELREQYYWTKYPHVCKDHGIPNAKSYQDDSFKGFLRCITDFIMYAGGSARQTNKLSGYRKINGKLTWVKMLGSRKADYDILAIFNSQEIHIRLISKDDEDFSKITTRMRDDAFKECSVRNMDEFLSWWEKNMCSSGAFPSDQNNQLFENQNK